jgi:hypothetical protein
MTSKEANIYIYRNLHKHNWSLKLRGKVICHLDYVFVKNPVFMVNQKGRDRVLKEKKKYVHAFVVSKNFETNYIHEDVSSLRPIYYNPYKTSCFVWKDNGSPVYSAGFCIMNSKGEVYGI